MTESGAMRIAAEAAEVTVVITLMTDSEAPYATQAIDSALNQTHPVDVVVVVGEKNNWIDDTLGPRSVRICRISPVPVGGARNQGSRLARTPYIAFMDGDDFWLPGKIAKQLKAVKETDADLVGVDHMLVDESGRPFARSHSRNIPMPSSWFIRRQVWEQRPFSDTVPVAEDIEWWLRNAKAVKIVRVPEPLLMYRVRGHSLSGQFSNKRRKLMMRRVSDAGFRYPMLFLSVLVALPFRSNKYVWRRDWDIPVKGPLSPNEANSASAAEVTAIITLMTDAEAPFARQAVDSVMRQTVPVEIIVVVDEKNTWIDSVLDLESIRVCRVPSCFAGRARNLGSRLADTPFIAYLDGDDFWLPTKIETQLKTAKETGADLVGTNHILIDEGGRPFAHSFSLYIPMTSSWLLRRQTWEERPFNETVFRSEDGEWWMRNCKAINIVRGPDALLMYRVRASSKSQSKNKNRKLFLLGCANAGLRPLIMSATSLLSAAYRSRRYMWHSDWG